MRGMWDQFDSVHSNLVEPLVREEWCWPWDELPRSLRLAAVNLGYDRMSWQTEEFEQRGQRFLDMEELMFEMENPGGVMWQDDVDGVQSGLGMDLSAAFASRLEAERDWTTTLHDGLRDG